MGICKDICIVLFYFTVIYYFIVLLRVFLRRKRG